MCRTPAPAGVRERGTSRPDALENDTFSWNDRPARRMIIARTPARGANVRLSMQLMMLRFGTGLSRETDRFDTAIAIPVRVVR